MQQQNNNNNCSGQKIVNKIKQRQNFDIKKKCAIEIFNKQILDRKNKIKKNLLFFNCCYNFVFFRQYKKIFKHKKNLQKKLSIINSIK